MAEFCKCGSIIINNHCTNKNCENKAASKSGTNVMKASAGSKSKEVKPQKTKRASKVITYNLYDQEPK